MIGLRRVRRFRYATSWFRYPLDLAIDLVSSMLNICETRGINDRRIVLWSKYSNFKPSVGHTLVRLGTDAQNLPFHGVTAREVALDREIAPNMS